MDTSVFTGWLLSNTKLSVRFQTVKLRGHPERSEGPHNVTKRHANVRWVISQLLGGPSPSPRLGMTAGLLGGVA
ncbi:MAG: hypothetical protein WA496_11065, partial [Candidatus Udaeobacter sp.]